MCSVPDTHFSSAVVCVHRLSLLHFFGDLMADLKENCQFIQEPRAPPFRNLKSRTLSLGQFSICEERGKYIGREGEKTESSDRRVM